MEHQNDLHLQTPNNPISVSYSLFILVLSHVDFCCLAVLHLTGKDMLSFIFQRLDNHCLTLAMYKNKIEGK